MLKRVSAEVKNCLKISHIHFLKHQWPLYPWGLNSSGRKLRCIFVLWSGWIYLVTAFSQERGVALQHEILRKKPSLSHCIFFTNACLDFGSLKSSFPLTEMTTG